MQQDPSAGVPQPLAPHLHLIANSHNYPLMAQLNLTQAVQYLRDAPSIVKQISPVSWTYVTAPIDGTIWLEWMSPRQNGGRFPSDGYIWSDPEQAFRQEVNGYTVELLVQSSGFRNGVDHMTSHARTRYHLIAKSPQVNAAPPDPSLWIVHYHRAMQNRIIPSAQINVDPGTRQQMGERDWIERTGRIERHDFMLHDREHWPTIPMPGQQRQMHPGAMYGNQVPPGLMIAPNRYHQQPFPQQGPPSAKRQRTHGPGPMPGMPEHMMPMPDTSTEEEEFIIYGDYFDTLTPRDLSITRYQQHHAWMEEIFESAYSVSDIVPVDLGLGLMGELAGLTEGLVEEAPLDVLIDRKERPGSKAGDAAFTNLSSAQVDQFNTRVQKFIEEGRAEMERMKSEHANKMRQWQRTHKLTQAERQLRSVSWKDQQSTIFAVTGAETNGPADAQKGAKLEDVMQNVEGVVGMRLKPHRDAKLIEKGGLTESEAPAQNSRLVNGSQKVSNAPSVAMSEGMSFLQDEALDGTPTGHGASTAQISMPQDTARGGEMGGNVGDEELGMDLLQDESMDIDGNGLNFELEDLAAANEGGNDGAQNQTLSAQDTIQASSSKPAITPGAEESALFDESGFDFTGGNGEDAGDGLIDFESGGMDDSAFGDALHGMDDGAQEDETFAE